MQALSTGLPPSGLSRKPRVAVVDEFRIPTVDLNLDGQKDLPHGVVVQTLLESLLDAEVVPFTNEDPVKVLTRFIPEQLDRISQSGDFEAVNISAGMHKSLRILAKKAEIPDLTPENLSQHREKIREYYLRTGEEDVVKVFQSIEKLTEAGVSVYLAGGNKGPDYVNLFGMARGAINVGAVNSQDQLVMSSAQNSLLRYAQGIYSVVPVGAGQLVGYDLNGVPPVEFASEQISPGESRIEHFRDRPVADLLAEARDYDFKIACDSQPWQCPIPKEDRLRDKVFQVSELARLGALTSAEFEGLKANQYEYVSFDDRLHFRANDQGNLVFDPDASGRDRAVGFIRGTSFAAPTALAEDLGTTGQN